MGRGINRTQPAVLDDQPHGVLDHAALAFVEAHKRGEHREAGASPEVQPAGRSAFEFKLNFAPLEACQPPVSSSVSHVSQM